MTLPTYPHHPTWSFIIVLTASQTNKIDLIYIYIYMKILHLRSPGKLYSEKMTFRLRLEPLSKSSHSL